MSDEWVTVRLTEDAKGGLRMEPYQATDDEERAFRELEASLRDVVDAEEVTSDR